MMFPPIGFLGSAENMAAPSTWATTWLVITTATPNWNHNRKRAVRVEVWLGGGGVVGWRCGWVEV